MHKLGLKIWSTNIAYIKSAKELYQDGIFDYLELYAVPASAGKYLREWEKINIPIMLHAPHSLAGFNLSLKEMESTNRRLLWEVEKFSKALKPKKVIFHPGTNGSLNETVRQVNSFKREFKGIFEMAVMENKPKTGVNGETCLGASVEEMKTVLDKTGLGFCLDMGHAICFAAWQGVGYQDTIDRFIQLDPELYHISDGDINSHTDKHLNFGKGNFDLPAIIARIQSDAFVSIETEKKSKSTLDDFKDDVSYFRKCAKMH